MTKDSLLKNKSTLQHDFLPWTILTQAINNCATISLLYIDFVYLSIGKMLCLIYSHSFLVYWPVVAYMTSLNSIILVSLFIGMLNLPAQYLLNRNKTDFCILDLSMLKFIHASLDLWFWDSIGMALWTT